jgi:hypothetical protein
MMAAHATDLQVNRCRACRASTGATMGVSVVRTPGEPLDRGDNNVRQGTLIGDLDEREDIGLAQHA